MVQVQVQRSKRFAEGTRVRSARPETASRFSRVWIDAPDLSTRHRKHRPCREVRARHSSVSASLPPRLIRLMTVRGVVKIRDIVGAHRIARGTSEVRVDWIFAMMEATGMVLDGRMRKRKDPSAQSWLEEILRMAHTCRPRRCRLFLMKCSKL